MYNYYYFPIAKTIRDEQRNEFMKPMGSYGPRYPPGIVDMALSSSILDDVCIIISCQGITNAFYIPPIDVLWMVHLT
jgi:hypothetical protein